MYKTCVYKIWFDFGERFKKNFLGVFLSGTQKIIMHINLNYWVVLMF